MENYLVGQQAGRSDFLEWISSLILFLLIGFITRSKKLLATTFYSDKEKR